MIELTTNDLAEAISFEYVKIYSKEFNERQLPVSGQLASIFLDLQNNLYDRHGSGFTSMMPYPSALYRVENNIVPMVANTVIVDTFADDEFYFTTSPGGRATYYLKKDRYLQLVDSVYDKYLSKEEGPCYFYSFVFNSEARDKDIDLTDFEDVRKIPKIHHIGLRAATIKL